MKTGLRIIDEERREEIDSQSKCLLGTLWREFLFKRTPTEVNRVTYKKKK